jgi:hypothetical protein
VHHSASTWRKVRLAHEADQSDMRHGTIEIGQGTFGWKNARGKKGFKRIAWSKLADILDGI